LERKNPSSSSDGGESSTEEGLVESREWMEFCSWDWVSEGFSDFGERVECESWCWCCDDGGDGFIQG